MNERFRTSRKKSCHVRVIIIWVWLVLVITSKITVVVGRLDSTGLLAKGKEFFVRCVGQMSC